MQEVLKTDDYSSDIEKYFNKHIYIFSYDGIIRKFIIKYKFNEKPYLYRTIINFIKKNKKKYLFLEKYDIILPVPISKKRKKQRGYNQSSLIAKNIAREFKIKYDENVLKKIKDIKPQSELTKEERVKNIQGAYKVKNYKKIINKKILLLDDVYTTGSTVNECSKKLIQIGALEVDVFTIAKD